MGELPIECAKNIDDAASTTETLANTNPPSDIREKIVRTAALFAQRTHPQIITHGSATATHTTNPINSKLDASSFIRRPANSLLRADRAARSATPIYTDAPVRCHVTPKPSAFPKVALEVAAKRTTRTSRRRSDYRKDRPLDALLSMA